MNKEIVHEGSVDGKHWIQLAVIRNGKLIALGSTEDIKFFRSREVDEPIDIESMNQSSTVVFKND